MKWIDLNINQSWTLFLDRDGVINRRLIGDYVKTWDDFVFENNALNAIADLSLIFGKIVIVTNQQGIGKGLMNQADLKEIHAKMLNKIKQSGGKIDAVFHAPKLADDPNNIRKPKPNMAWLAQQQFPQINFKKSIMVGDMPTDMAFATRLGMIRVAINNEIEADFHYPSLFHFAQHLKQQLKP